MMDKAAGGAEVTRVRSSGVSPVVSTWDGPHFELFRCGANHFRETAPRISLFLDTLGPLGCWEYVISGSIYYKVGRERYRVSAGEALISQRPDAGWLLRPVEGVPLRTLWLFVRGDAALRMLSYLRNTYGQIQRFPANGRVVRLARQLIDLAYEEPARPAHFWSWKTFQWMNAWWQYAQEHQGALSPEGRAVPPLSELAAQTPRTVKSFAAQMGYSRSYLTRKLTAQWQMSPGEVFRRVRLENGAELLRTTSLSIGEIARRVGYGASAAFGRAFLELYEQTPRAYRHKHQ